MQEIGWIDSSVFISFFTHCTVSSFHISLCLCSKLAQMSHEGQTHEGIHRSGRAAWEDKNLSDFWENTWLFILWADRFLKPEVENLINRSKMSVGKNSNFLFGVQWSGAPLPLINLFNYWGGSESLQCLLLTSGIPFSFLFVFALKCIWNLIKRIFFKPFILLHIIPE